MKNRRETFKKSIFISIHLVTWFVVLTASSLTFGQTGEPRTKTNQTQSFPGVIENDADNRGYDYVLSLPGEDLEHDYNRREIENFLCCMSEGFIQANEVYRNSYRKFNQYNVKAKREPLKEKERAYKKEISKWFEDQVTVTTRGRFHFLDISTIRRFFDTVNRVIGKKKFIFLPNELVANIVIEMTEEDDFFHSNGCIGETSLLEDNLRVRLGIKNEKMFIDTYNSSIGELIYLPRGIRFLPEEIEFKKENRFVKAIMKRILDPQSRHFALIHECFHAIGFSGHSPYLDSHLFPMPVKAYDSHYQWLKVKGDILSPLALKMIEMLYRPELLPGMTIEEAAHLLPTLKVCEKTTPAQLAAFFNQKQNQVEQEKKQLLLQGQKEYDQKMSVYLELNKMELKSLDLLAELKEFRQESKLPFSIFSDIRNAETRIKKLSRIRQELIFLESKYKILTEKSKQPDYKEKRKARYRLKLIKSETTVVKDLLATNEKSSQLEKQLGDMGGNQLRRKLEEQLRKILRQQIIIKKVLEPSK